MTVLCPFCLYINDLSQWKPKLESYYVEHDTIPHGFTHIENSGAKLTHEYKLEPRADSDMFDKSELLIVCPRVKRKLIFWLDKYICDICLYQLYSENNCIIVRELDENEKLFRLFMRKSNNHYK
jgi:hypothetical protein